MNVETLKNREAELKRDQEAAQGLERDLKKALDPSGDLNIRAAGGDPAAVEERDRARLSLSEARTRIREIGDEFRTAVRDRGLAESEARWAEQAAVEATVARAREVVEARRAAMFEGGGHLYPNGSDLMLELARAVELGLNERFGDDARYWDETFSEEFGVRRVGPHEFDPQTGFQVEPGTLVAGGRISYHDFFSASGEVFEAPDSRDPWSGLGRSEGPVVDDRP